MPMSHIQAYVFFMLRVYPLLTADWSDLDRVGMGPWTLACGAGDAGAPSLADKCPGVPGKRFRETHQTMLHTAPGVETPL